MKKMKKIILASVMLLMLSACGGQQAVRDDSAATQNQTEQSTAQAGSVSTPAVAAETTLAGQKYNISYEKGAINDPGNILSQKTIYFDFDSSELRPEYLDLVKYHGKYLALNPDVHVRLEGHTDERGSREYNIALADRRAQSVKRLMMFQGVRDDQITIISYGEEKPADPGHNEQAWAKNRRVEIVYE
jgi:peptidoglycan-associated lipoprotein